MTALLSHWGVWGIGIMYLLEGLAVPWPIEIPLWISGRMLVEGSAGYWQLVWFTWLGTSVGNLVAFTIARRGGRPLLLFLSSRLHMDDEVQRLQGWIDRYGLMAVVFTRWINWGFGLTLWLTGFSRLPPGRTLGLMVLNNALWACAFVALGRILVGALHLAGLPGWLVLVPGVIILMVLGFMRLWRNRRIIGEGES
jgi:membrane-associated protein